MNKYTLVRVLCQLHLINTTKNGCHCQESVKKTRQTRYTNHNLRIRNLPKVGLLPPIGGTKNIEPLRSQLPTSLFRIYFAKTPTIKKTSRKENFNHRNWILRMTKFLKMNVLQNLRSQVVYGLEWVL